MRRKIDNSKTTAELRQGARNYLTELRRQRSELSVPRGQGSIPSAARIPSTKPTGGTMAKPVEAKLSRAPTMNAVIRETAGVQAPSHDKKRGEAISRLQGISGKNSPSALAKPAQAPAPMVKRSQRLGRTAKPAPFVAQPVIDVTTIAEPAIPPVEAPLAACQANQSTADYSAWLEARAAEREAQRIERAEQLEARRVERATATSARVIEAQQARAQRATTRAAHTRPPSPPRPASSVSELRAQRNAARVAALEAAATARAAAAATEAAKEKLAEDKARARDAALAAAAARKAEHRAAVEQAEADRLAKEIAAKAKIEAAAKRRADAAATRKAQAAAVIKAEAARLAAAEAEQRKADAAEKRRVQAVTKREAQAVARFAAEAERLALEQAEQEKADAAAKRRADAAAKRKAKAADKTMLPEAGAEQPATLTEAVMAAAETEVTAPAPEPELPAEVANEPVVETADAAHGEDIPEGDVDVAALIAQFEEQAIPPAPVSYELSAIANLGPAMRNRLNQLGINDVTDLAAVDPDGLRHLLGPISALANVDRWVADAQAMLTEQKLAA